MRNKSDLYVITKARDLMGYVLNVTIKSPKNLRFTYVNKIQNMAIDALSLLVEANDIELSFDTLLERRTLQNKARNKLKMLGYLSFVGAEQGAILLKQYEQIALQIDECIALLKTWIESDKKRLARNEQKQSSMFD